VMMTTDTGVVVVAVVKMMMLIVMVTLQVLPLSLSKGSPVSRQKQSFDMLAAADNDG
jgi:hypothetical protein